jgi:CheY-like chemotaxis protein
MRKLQDCLPFKKKPEQPSASKNSNATQPPQAKWSRGQGEDRFLTAAEVRAKFSTLQKTNESQKDAKIETAKPAANLADAKVITLESLSPDQFETYFPSENSEPKVTRSAPAPSVGVAVGKKEPASNLKSAGVEKPEQSERRAKRRALISAPVRVRSIDLTHNSLNDVTTTLNVSRLGVLIASSNPIYQRGMDVMITFPYSKAPNSTQAEQPGRVVHVSELDRGRRSVAITLNVTQRQDDFIQTSGEKVHAEPAAAKTSIEPGPETLRPLVLAVDADPSVRESLKSYLTGEGYDVITLADVEEAREVLSRRTPSLLIAEFERVGMPGYDICSHCKSTPRLQGIPVILTTSSAYPSDYASAHSLGAVVCLAKPYRQERLGHVVKLLAPPPKSDDKVASPQSDKASRHQHGNGSAAKVSSNRRYPFSSKK